ncbi:hypothetical protein PC128_g582 [Phytophthora cactorum]|nr:hypothetical protein PC128_g582 [Phytophthora cactorum]
MKAGTSDTLTRAGTLNKALRGAIFGAFDFTRRLPRGVCEEVTEKSAQSDVVSVDHSEAEHVSMPSSNTKKLRKSYENSSLFAIVSLKERPSEDTAIETAQTEDTMLDDEGDSGHAVHTPRTLFTAVFQAVRSVDVGEPPKEPLHSEEKYKVASEQEVPATPVLPEPARCISPSSNVDIRQGQTSNSVEG